MSLWDAICIHACYHLWNPVGLILHDKWVEAVWQEMGMEYPGWKALR
ncbi:hypothetical protein O4H53_25950 [Sulfitobacter sp. G21635-S1]|nr:hypothetical protein [Sulfitobacter sp. G21635-S1]MCZ4258998.1 hypothetical protein [Sulfitobacter sp. G21635-S1]